MIRAFLIGGGVIAALSALVIAKSVEEAGLRSVIKGHEACAAAIKDGEPLTRCLPSIAQAAVTARKSAACDAALVAEARFSQSASCSPPVLQLVAQRDVFSRERDRAETTLAEIRRDQAAALARAEARGRTQTQRTQSVQTRLEAAPRTDAGLGRCDAECLSRLGAD